ncbi:MAG TPA: hypothetical protein VIG55_05285 [Methylosinus sp.]|jgi:hypothetical protein
MGMTGDMKKLGSREDLQKIEEGIKKIDEVISLIDSIDPLSSNLLLTTKTLLWSKIHSDGHPCSGCAISREIKRLSGN